MLSVSASSPARVIAKKAIVFHCGPRLPLRWWQDLPGRGRNGPVRDLQAGGGDKAQPNTTGTVHITDGLDRSSATAISNMWVLDDASRALHSVSGEALSYFA